MELNSKNVNEILMDCLYREEEITCGEIPSGAIIVKGIQCNFGLNPQRLNTHLVDIKSMLLQLPIEFRESNGGGWSFLNACITVDNRHWGEHKDIEALFALGCGLGITKFLMPRELWHTLPGGMPYFSIKDSI